MITPEKRKEMEEFVYAFYDKLDPTKRNSEKWKAIFASMSDKDFDTFFQKLFADPNAYMTLDIVDYEVTLNMEQVENAAKFLKIPLFEKVAFPHYTMDKGNIVVTKHEVPVGYAHIKRTQQTVAKKNGLSTSADIRSSTTGQVTGGDKNGRESDLENSMLVSMGMVNVLKELNGPRADDTHMKDEMYTEIGKKGYVSLTDLDSDPKNKTTLNTVNTYLLGMGIISDLVTKGGILRSTIDE